MTEDNKQKAEPSIATSLEAKEASKETEPHWDWVGNLAIKDAPKAGDLVGLVRRGSFAVPECSSAIAGAEDLLDISLVGIGLKASVEGELDRPEQEKGGLEGGSRVQEFMVEAPKGSLDDFALRWAANLTMANENKLESPMHELTAEIPVIVEQDTNTLE